MAWVSTSFRENDRVQGPEPIRVHQLQDGQRHNPNEGKLSAGHWAWNKETPPHVLAGAAVLGGFDAHREVTEEEYDAAVRAFHEVKIGPQHPAR